MKSSPISFPISEMLDQQGPTMDQHAVVSMGPQETGNRVVSGDLGRGDEQVPVLVSAYTKNGTVPTRKRKTPGAESSKAKRQKSSTVNSALFFAKGSLRNTTKSSESGRDDAAIREVHTRGPPIATYDRETRVSNGVKDGVNIMPATVSIYAPSTSMDVIDPTSVRTAVYSLKASEGHGCTLYSSAPEATLSTTSHTGGLNISQPFLQDSQIIYGDPGGRAREQNCCMSASTAATLNLDDIAGQTRVEEDVAESEQAHNIQYNESQELQQVSFLTSEANPAPQESWGGLEEVRDDSDFIEMIDCADFPEDDVQFSSRSPALRTWKQNMREGDEHGDHDGDVHSSSEGAMLNKLKPQTDDDMKPIVRKPFPKAVLDRSPIFGASSGMLLRTCFRIGEALNTGSQAVRTNKNLVLELYARVTSSWREENPGRKQHFIFKDLYHDKPPHLNGTFELWNQSCLWNLDSKGFLEACDSGIKCRAIARMKREGKEWYLDILNIWQADWEDINFAVTIFCDDGQ